MAIKTFEQLSEAEQSEAERIALDDLVQIVCEGAIRFNDAANGDDLQARIDAAMTKANDMQTPWFAAEYLRDDPFVWELLQGMARCDAEDAEYRTKDDPRIVTLGAAHA